MIMSYTAWAGFMACPQKYKYERIDGWESPLPALGREFGSALHIAVGGLYDSGDLEEAVKKGQEVWAPWEGMDRGKDGKGGLRTAARLREVLTAYYEQLYKGEQWEDEGGERYEERWLGSEIDKVNEEIKYRFKIDRKGKMGGVPAIQEWKFLAYPGYFCTEPNHQVAGYLWGTGARKAVVTTAGVGYVGMKNGVMRQRGGEERSIFSRDVVGYEEWVFEEWRRDVLMTARMIRKCEREGVWPRNAPGACGSYGGCPFRVVCASPLEQREVLLEMQFRKKGRKKDEKD